MTVVFVNEYIVYQTVTSAQATSEIGIRNLLFLVSPSPMLGGANEKGCICAVCGSNGRLEGPRFIRSLRKIDLLGVETVVKVEML